MSTPLTEQIRAYFDDVDRQQGAVDIAAVRRGVEEATIVLELSRDDTRPPRAATSRRRPIIIAAAVVLLVVSSLVLTAQDDTEPQVPAGPPPATDDLVISVWSHPLAGGQAHVRVYADGRFLRAQRYPDSWMERRLTPEGVELLRSEIIATGMFDPDQPFPDSGQYPGGVPFTHLGTVQVVNGDTMVKVDCCWGPGLDWLSAFDPLIDRLREPEAWLPPSAWETGEERAYVPSRYAVCLESPDMDPQPLEPSPLLATLPAPASAILDTARHWVESGAVGGITQAAQHCFDIDAYSAREFLGVVDAAGVARIVPGEWGRALDAGPDVGTLSIWTAPYLPDGELGYTPG